MTHEAVENITGTLSGIGGGFASYQLLDINALPVFGIWGELITSLVMAVFTGALGYFGVQLGKYIHKKIKG